jgi:pimeloyl-ACP methyl ester carboxylesterase
MISGAGVEKGVASVGDLRIVYESAGTGAPAVMLIHGGFENRTYFTHQMMHLASSRRVIALDLRGHGESDVSAAVSWEDFAADVIAVAADAGVESAVLCGHSMAGSVALTIAAARPELVRGIVMLDAAILFPEVHRRQVAENFLPALATDHWLDALRGFFAGTLDPQDPPEVAARVMADLGRTRPEIARSFFSSAFGAEFAGRQRRQADALKNLRCPLLFVHAKVPTDLQRLRELRPDAMIEQVAGSGHYLMLSVPDQINAMLDRFLTVAVPRQAGDVMPVAAATAGR